MAQIVSTTPEPVSIPAALSAMTADMIRRSVPESTRAAYERQWSKFATWCEAEGVTSLPAHGDTFAEYTGWLTRTPTMIGTLPSVATIQQAHAAIRAMHRYAGHEGRPDSKRALAVLKTYRRERADQRQGRKQSAPVTVQPLRAMVATLDLETTIGLRDRLMLVLGFAGMLRRSELVALQLDDVTETDDGLIVFLARSKTDQDAAGATVAIPPGSHPHTDAVRAWHDWTEALAAAGITEGRLLRSVSRHGHIGDSWSTEALNKRVKAIAAAAGVEGVTAHGLRAGGPTEAARKGVPGSFIRDHGRWKSGVWQEYVRRADQFRDNPMAGIGL